VYHDNWFEREGVTVNETIQFLLSPMFRTRLVQLRKLQNLTQQALADGVGVHVNQIRRYESGEAQPSLDALIGLAKALHISLDDLVFEKYERGPSEDLALQFEAISHMPEEERGVVKAVLDGLILKYQARQWMSPSPQPTKPPARSLPKQHRHQP
jgi:transcriptional regulator with XRE-family HTH domain